MHTPKPKTKRSLFGNKEAAAGKTTGAGSGASVARAPQNKHVSVTSIVAYGMLVQGEVVRQNGQPLRLHVDGRIQGEVAADEVVIGETGSITGTVQATTIQILGRVEGEVLAEDVKIGPAAMVRGTVSYDALDIDRGANVTADLKKRTGSEEGETTEAAPGDSKQTAKALAAA